MLVTPGRNRLSVKWVQRKRGSHLRERFSSRAWNFYPFLPFRLTALRVRKGKLNWNDFTCRRAFVAETSRAGCGNWKASPCGEQRAVNLCMLSRNVQMIDFKYWLGAEFSLLAFMFASLLYLHVPTLLMLTLILKSFTYHNVLVNNIWNGNN